MRSLIWRCDGAAQLQSDAHRTLQFAGPISAGSRISRSHKERGDARDSQGTHDNRHFWPSPPCSAPAAAAAQAQFGTAAEAKALLDKAVVALKADKAKALTDFNNAGAGFRDRDLYVFCAGADKQVSGTPQCAADGDADSALVDKTGKKLGEEIMAAAAEGEVAEVELHVPAARRRHPRRWPK